MSKVNDSWVGYCIGFSDILVKPEDFAGMPDAVMITAFALGKYDARAGKMIARPEDVLQRVRQLLTPVAAPAVALPVDKDAERAQLIELCGRVSAYEAAYAAIDGAINDPALDTARTYEIIRNALASVTK